MELIRNGKLHGFKLQGNESSGTKILLRYKGDLILKRGLLYRIQEIGSERSENIKVLPRNMLFPLLTLQKDVTDKQIIFGKGQYANGSLLFMKSYCADELGTSS